MQRAAQMLAELVKRKDQQPSRQSMGFQDERHMDMIRIAGSFSQCISRTIGAGSTTTLIHGLPAGLCQKGRGGLSSCAWPLLVLIVGYVGPLWPILMSPGSAWAKSAASPACSSAKWCMAQGVASFQRRDFEQAVIHWSEAARFYKNARDALAQSMALTHVSQGFHALGQYSASLEALNSAQRLLQGKKLVDRKQLAFIKANLGNVYLATELWDQAQTYLYEALSLVREEDNIGLETVILNNIGNLFMAKNKYEKALDAYRQSTTLSRKIASHIRAAGALTHAAMAATQDGRYKEATVHLNEAWEFMQELPVSHDKAYTLLNLGLVYYNLWQRLRKPNNLAPLSPGISTQVSGCRGRMVRLSETHHASATSTIPQRRDRAMDVLLLQASKVFHEASVVAKAVTDLRAASYAWGYLARLYEDEQQCNEALQLTRRAIFAAQQVKAPESLYQWQWQAGRVLKAQGKLEEATKSYRQAVETLQSVDPDVVTRFGPVPSSFRETVKPVFLGFVDLLLQQSASQHVKKQDSLLAEARETAERLKAAELQDYFRDDCIDREQKDLTPLDDVLNIFPTAVIVYPLILRDRLELLVTMPKGLLRYPVQVSADVITQEVQELRKKLEDQRTWEFLPHAQQLYEWLIRPFEKDLPVSTDTLVFVPDGPLLTIPMAALVDGEQFLIQKYAVAITPGLSLQAPRPLQREKTKILAAGLAAPAHGFPPLPEVAEELHIIRELYPKHSVLLPDQDFSLASLEKRLQDPHLTMVHIASHAQFQSEAEQTYILTSDDRLTLDRLEKFVKRFRFRDNPLELLALSACETAAGDERAALGLAGLAVKAGAKSALATLWTIDDPAAVQLVAEFYRQLKETNVSRAIALQQAQLALIDSADDVQDYQHPAFWAPFLLINNWL